MLSASFSQSMVTLFASYSALGGFGLGLLHHHPEYNHQFFINYSDHPHHWASKLWSWSKMSIPHPKNLLNLLFTFFSFRNHSEHQQYNLCNASSPLPPLFWFSSSKGFLYLPAVVASQGHFTRYIIQNTGLQLWIIRFHYMHELQWIAVITCTSCKFSEASSAKVTLITSRVVKDVKITGAALLLLASLSVGLGSVCPLINCFGFAQ